ncbi:hypothetical protein FEK35_09075 [Nocardia cyriacigeorgica]|uniref:DUF885 domain-containing protein n=1 Tax=Nocardia cyriacigeorgica TaxID=135487 RepID=A0A5R8PGA6_9NOCA|nr:hypothetical protein [Nocardia cyriacigeorgica]TLG13919.1 hypothetical protein FEK35_09075 [Nocardia cyriacigeorgica]
MSTRDAIETAIRAWDRHETDRGAPAVIDFDFHPPEEGAPSPAPADRLTTLRRLCELLDETDEPALSQRVRADVAYLRALMGERLPLDTYVRATQGCPANGWPDTYVSEKGEIAREAVAAFGVTWGENTRRELAEVEGVLEPEKAPDAIRAAAAEYEPAVRRATNTTADYDLTIEAADVDAYWAYWLDGAGHRVRLRLNTRNASYTVVQARQFALHEVLGHGLQSAAIAARCATEDVPWVRLLSVHGPQQVLLEGWAQAAPLFITPDDPALVARVRLEHYAQLVRAELQLAINAGMPVEACAARAQSRIPWWTDGYIADLLTDRSTNPQLRTYMWAYAAGIDWFVNLADSASPAAETVLFHSYRSPLTPAELQQLWPEGPTIGGPGTCTG